MEKLMNEWDHKISAGVKNGPADCIRIDEVAAVLKKMKRHKTPGLSALAAEMIQVTGDIGTQSILDLCRGLEVKCGITNLQRKRDPMECGSYIGIKLLEHAMKVWCCRNEDWLWNAVEVAPINCLLVKHAAWTH